MKIYLHVLVAQMRRQRFFGLGLHHKQMRHIRFIKRGRQRDGCLFDTGNISARNRTAARIGGIE